MPYKAYLCLAHFCVPTYPTSWIHYLSAGAQRALRLLDKAVTHGSARQMFVQLGVVAVHLLRLLLSADNKLSRYGNQPTQRPLVCSQV
jgi:hypothetical protein